jgi:hypothetical protein
MHSAPRCVSYRRRSMIEPLESRQLLSSTATSELLDFTAGSTTSAAGTLALTNSSSITNNTLTVNYGTLATTTPAAPVLPNVKRNYLGDAFDQKHVKLALVIKIRKQENRGSYASLRGDVRIGTPSPIQILFTSITYGKLRSNLRIDFQFSGNGISGTISGKVYPSGSQIKGGYVTTGSYKSSGTFVINKAVGIG